MSVGLNSDTNIDTNGDAASGDAQVRARAGLPRAVSRRDVLRGLAGAGLGVPLAAALAACGSDGHGGSGLSGTAVMSNYPGWMGSHVIADFEKLHPGSKIKTVSSASSNISGTVQQMKSGQFDFAIADASSAQQAHDIGLIQTLSSVPNLKNVDASFRTGFPHGIPTDYGKVGIGYRPDLIGERITSWHDVWRLAPKFSGKVVFIDLDRDCMGSTMKYLGKSGNSTKASDLAACKTALLGIKPHLQGFLSANYGQGLQDGSTVIAMDYDYDVAVNQQKNPKIEWVYPSEGMVAYLEGWVALKSSSVTPLVEAFMNFALQPKQYANFVNTTGTAFVETAATSYIQKSITSSPQLKPGGHRGHVEYEHFLGAATADWTTTWEEVKAG